MESYPRLPARQLARILECSATTAVKPGPERKQRHTVAQGHGCPTTDRADEEGVELDGRSLLERGVAPGIPAALRSHSPRLAHGLVKDTMDGATGSH